MDIQEVKAILRQSGRRGQRQITVSAPASASRRSGFMSRWGLGSEVWTAADLRPDPPDGAEVGRHGRRGAVRCSVATSPTAGWVAQQLRKTLPCDSAPRFMIFDRDHVIFLNQRHLRLRIKRKLVQRRRWGWSFGRSWMGVVGRQRRELDLVAGDLREAPPGPGGLGLLDPLS